MLDRATDLHCLHIRQDPLLLLQTSLFKYTNASVRQLALRNGNHCFIEEECTKLSHSLLGIQCEVLSILVKNRESIIYFIKNMINLRALNVRCEDDKSTVQLALTKNDNGKLKKDKLVRS